MTRLQKKEDSKQRVVVRGDLQSDDELGIFAPILRMDALRSLVMIAASKPFKPFQCDISTAFLYGTLEKPVYLELPEVTRKRKRKTKYGEVNPPYMHVREAQESGTRARQFSNKVWFQEKFIERLSLYPTKKGRLSIGIICR